LKLVYLGSPEAAVAPLRALVNAGHEIMLVVSQPDRRRGRGATLLPSPVKAAALELGLPVTSEVNDVLGAAANGADLGVVVAFGRLIKPNLLEALPFVNLHFSLLPLWRGAAPVERSLMAGDAQTGVCLMALEEGLDTGGVYRRESTEIDPKESAAELRSRLVDVGSRMLVDALSLGTVEALGTPAPQVGEPTWAAKLAPEEFEIDWLRTADELHRLVRVRPSWTTFRGKRFKLHRVTPVHEEFEHRLAGPGSFDTRADQTVVCCGSGALQLVEVQPEGKPVMLAMEWRNGAQIQPGERLGDSPSAPQNM
jgi:methionyl-tRNA formyltransferase